MYSIVQNFLEKYNIKNKKVIVGFSSGPDSCAMAFILSKLKEMFNLEIVLAYFNHNWRKDEVQSEIDFACDFAKKIGAEFYFETAPDDVLKTEEVARELRYSFFENCLKKFNTDIVFLAHNKDDNIETVVYRLIKGTGVKGLCAIPEVRDCYYRPLLNVLKEDIISFLNENKLDYKIDSSNNDIKYKRNLIRKEILPLFSKINPSYKNNIENLIKNAISTREVVDIELEKFKNKILNSDNSFNRELFLEEDKPMRYEFLNFYIGDKLKCRNYKNIKKFDDFIIEHKSLKTSVNKELFLKLKRNKIYFVDTNDTQVE